MLVAMLVEMLVEMLVVLWEVSKVALWAVSLVDR